MAFRELFPALFHCVLEALKCIYKRQKVSALNVTTISEVQWLYVLFLQNQSIIVRHYKLETNAHN